MSGQQKALWLKEAKGKLVVGPKAIDKPGHGELLVKIEATALNPVSTVILITHVRRANCVVAQVDWKVHQYAFAFEVRRHQVIRRLWLTVTSQHYPVVLGTDSAGVVEEIGEGVTGWKKGDRV
jgi:NADPH:quinone reductase-like Zn-dependent oxidoreductase